MFNLCKNSITFESSKRIVKETAKFIVKGDDGEGLINALDIILKEKS